MEIYITAPVTKEKLKSLRAGDRVYLSCDIYTARDAAHKRLFDAAAAGKQLPFNPDGKIIYYAGPAPAKPGEVIGSCGPTTAGRVDAYTPFLLDMGLVAMIGKGDRSESVINSIRKNSCVYFAALGGAGALIADCIKETEPVCYEDLGTEAIVRLRAENMPLTVAVDSTGESIYKTAREKYEVR